MTEAEIVKIIMTVKTRPELLTLAIVMDQKIKKINQKSIKMVLIMLDPL